MISFRPKALATMSSCKFSLVLLLAHVPGRPPWSFLTLRKAASCAPEAQLHSVVAGQLATSGAVGKSPTVRALIIRIGLWGPCYHSYNKLGTPQNSISNYEGPYIDPTPKTPNPCICILYGPEP